MHQRAGALLGRDRGRVRHGVADLAQGHEAEQGRQIEDRRSRHRAFSEAFPADLGRDVIFVWNTYNLGRMYATTGVAWNR
jgi:hypothetical protein